MCEGFDPTVDPCPGRCGADQAICETLREDYSRLLSRWDDLREAYLRLERESDLYKSQVAEVRVCAAQWKADFAANETDVTLTEANCADDIRFALTVGRANSWRLREARLQEASGVEGA